MIFSKEKLKHLISILIIVKNGCIQCNSKLCEENKCYICLNQGSQIQLTWGPLELEESGSGWAASNIPKKGAQLIQSSQSLLLTVLQYECFREHERFL